MSRRAYREFGFTIVELLIVIVVIAILAAISVVAYTGIQKRANIAGVQSNLSSLHRRISIWKIDNGTYPSSRAQFKTIIDNHHRDPNLGAWAYVVCSAPAGADYAIAARHPLVLQPDGQGDPLMYVSSRTGGVTSATYSQTHPNMSVSICNKILPESLETGGDIAWYGYL